jgi:VWFA-related protein
LQARIGAKSLEIYREDFVFRAAPISLTSSIGIFLLSSFAANSANGQSPVVPQSKEQIRVVTNEVSLAVTATNAHGEFVVDLARQDFHVFDDGAEQALDRWDLAGDPLSVALVIETSSRVRAMAPAIHGIASIFTETVMAMDGEAAVITYDSDVILRQAFTQDHDAVAKAIAETKFEAPERNLYDAMAMAVDGLKAQPSSRRRIMLVLGESQDEESTAKLGEITRDAEHANITIYVVGPSSVAADLRVGQQAPAPTKLGGLPPVATAPPKNDHMDRPFFDLVTPAIWLLERGTNEVKHHQLEVAAAATGGIQYRAFRDSTIRSAIDRIGDELHSQYIMSYRPKSPPSPGFHKIDVTIARPGVFVRARPGYYVTDSRN